MNTMQPNKNIILFGGSFDPIHNGHLEVAACAFERLRGDRLIFVPARRSPHKSAGPTASGRARLEMIRLAIAGRSGAEVSDCELQRPEPSYTLDTIRHFRTQVGQDAEMFWLIGADAAADLEHWHRIDELLASCRVCMMHRGGMPPPALERLIPALGPDRVRRLQADVLRTPLIDISSTDIRTRLAEGKPVQALLPPAVLNYIRQNNLYSARP